MKNLLTIFILGGLLFPLVSLAGEYKNTSGATISYEGLVPCGGNSCVGVSEKAIGDKMKEMEKNKSPITFQQACTQLGGNWRSPQQKNSISCQFCHFFVMFGELVNFLIFKITIPAAVLLLVISGAMFVFAAGNPGWIKKGQDIMKSVVIGLVIIFLAYLVVGAFLSFIGLADWTAAIYRDWNSGFFQLNCPIKI